MQRQSEWSFVSLLSLYYPPPWGNANFRVSHEWEETIPYSGLKEKLIKIVFGFIWQMPINVSRWHSRWWRWMEMRWPGSSGSSSKKRCLNGKRVSERMRGREAVSVWSIFKSVTHTHTSREKQNAGGQRIERNRRVRSLYRDRQNENWVRQE